MVVCLILLFDALLLTRLAALSAFAPAVVALRTANHSVAAYVRQFVSQYQYLELLSALLVLHEQIKLELSVAHTVFEAG